jgi:hypothetical protein
VAIIAIAAAKEIAEKSWTDADAGRLLAADVGCSGSMAA